MNSAIFNKGGLWDKFSGKDGVMSLDETRKMQQFMMKFEAKMLKGVGEKIAPY